MGKRTQGEDIFTKNRSKFLKQSDEKKTKEERVVDLIHFAM